MKRLIGFLVWLTLIVPAIAAPPIYGPLQVQNNLSEFDDNGTQATALSNLGGASSSGNNTFTGNNTFSGTNTFNNTVNLGSLANATTQPTLDNSTLISTDAFVNSSIIRAEATSPITITGGTYNYASLGSGMQVVVLALSGPVTEILTLVSGGSGYADGDVLYLSGGNHDAIVQVTNEVGGVVQPGGVAILYGGTGYISSSQATGIQPQLDARNTITLTGALTSDATFIFQSGTFLTSSHQLIINNNTTGSHTVTFCQTNGADACNGGPSVVIPQGSNNSCASIIQKDGETGIWFAAMPVCAAPGGAGLINVQVFMSSGTYTPDAGTQAIIVEVVAQGGGGGGCASTTSTQNCVAGSGGAGSYAKVYYTSASTETVTIGTTGTGGAAGDNNGTPGATTSFGSLISCAGGIAGLGGAAIADTTTYIAGFTGSFPATCTVPGGTIINRIQGMNYFSSYAFGTGTPGALISGTGGSNPLGYGGYGVSGFGAGINGVGHGSGASGAASSNGNTSFAGGNPGGGEVIVEEYN